MTIEEKTAIARLASDILKADGLLSVEQFELYNEMKEEYHLTDEIISRSRHLTFCQALDMLRGLTRLEKKDLQKQMHNLAFCDNVSTMEEGMLLTTMYYKLEHGVKHVPAESTDKDLCGSISMTYMESEEHEGYNAELSTPERFRLIRSICKEEGIHFGYLPAITSGFTKIPQESMVSILKYMHPSLTDEDAINVGRRMSEITTTEFYYKVLHISMEETGNQQKQFLLVKSNISMTPYCQADGDIAYIKEYICLPIEGSVLETVDKFIDIYKTNVTTSYSAQLSEDGLYDFRLYKRFFNFLLTPPPVMPDLIFLGQEPLTGKHAIMLRFIHNNKRITLTPKEYDAFLTIVDKTLHSRQKGMPIGLDRTNLAPVISHIRQKITRELPEIGMQESLLPERKGNVYTARLNDIKVFIRRYTTVNEWTDEQISK